MCLTDYISTIVVKTNSNRIKELKKKSIVETFRRTFRDSSLSVSVTHR